MYSPHLAHNQMDRLPDGTRETALRVKPTYLQTDRQAHKQTTKTQRTTLGHQLKTVGNSKSRLRSSNTGNTFWVHVKWSSTHHRQYIKSFPPKILLFLCNGPYKHVCVSHVYGCLHMCILCVCVCARVYCMLGWAKSGNSGTGYPKFEIIGYPDTRGSI